jgi:hypothetical protein
MQEPVAFKLERVASINPIYMMNIRLIYLLLSFFFIEIVSAQQLNSNPAVSDAGRFHREIDEYIFEVKDIWTSPSYPSVLYIKRNDLIPSAPGELCLLDSVLQFASGGIASRTQFLDVLYLEVPLPEHAVKALTELSTITHILLQPSKMGYTQQEFKRLEALQGFKDLEYLEAADTSLAFIERLRTLENLHTLVWLDTLFQNPYLEHLINIKTLIIGQYKNLFSYPVWRNPRKGDAFFPCQLTVIETELLHYSDFVQRIPPCVQLDRLVAVEGEVENPNAIITSRYKTKEDRVCRYKRARLMMWTVVEDSSLSEHKLFFPTQPLPNCVYQLHPLKELYTKAYSLSDSIRYLHNLERLWVEEVNALPDSLGHLSKLRSLQLRYALLKNIPPQIYQLQQLEKLLLRPTVVCKRQLLHASKLRQLSNLKHLQIDFRAVKNEFHYRKVYKALPENCSVEWNDTEPARRPLSRASMGVYGELGWEKPLFTGIEVLYYFVPHYHSSFVKKKGLFRQKNLIRRKDIAERLDYFAYSYTTLNPFHFHTLSMGVEWNYRRGTDFLMGYRVGLSHSRTRNPLAFQVDVVAYTNYRQTLDLRLAPRLSLAALRSSGAYIYFYYSYKAPLLPEQENRLVARHTVGCNIRLTHDWKTSILEELLFLII